MNRHQKIVCAAIAVIITMMMLYPPFQLINERGNFNAGFHFIWLTNNGTVNVLQLLVQLVAALILGGIGLLALKDKD